MKKSEIKQMPEYFGNYVNLVEDIDLNDALLKFGPVQFAKEKDRFEKIGDKVYAPGKWTIKDILQHLIDTERIFNYRALTIARKDETKIPGFDEDFYAEKSNAVNRSLDELLEEFETVRKSSIFLFKSFDNETLSSDGFCNNKKISVLALGFVIAGHPIHHFNTLKERYFTL